MTATTHLIDIVFPGDTNHHGTLFGGTALSHMDKLAFVAATRFGRRPFVTASCDRIDFTAPASRGHLIDLQANIVKAGRRSATVQVDMYAEHLLTGDRQLCTRGHFTMVSPDKDQPPLPPAPTDETQPVDEDILCNRVEMVFPDQTNHYGTLFGGNALAMMGKTAFITASRHSRRVFVMASSQRTDFIAPAQGGEIIDLKGRVKYTGRSSLVVEVSMTAEDVIAGDRRLCARSEFVMVAVDAAGKPEPLSL
ncbi:MULTISPECIES: acyl-CoA thioesterase [Kordiimonas]|jgi:acyl-CoA hydrolase|uniref:acyl-CoA thioesterase n=1 Tax=Kordiimonas TaxID=288021 RepID=UPI00257C90F0|nr:acyl-CoA thioesterase [Kordiimonas sp. UBA4487]